MIKNIAIDGPAGAGKGTIAKALADKLGFFYLDTGLLYRAIGAAVLKGGDPIEVSKSLSPEMLAQSNLRSPEVSAEASKIAQIPELRDNLIAFQRAFANRTPGAVLDGRDIGTVILPDAGVKLFITAKPHIRAERRLAELRKAGDSSIAFDAVLAELKKRDARDAGRAHAPLKAAPDAHILDTSAMDIDASIKAAFEIARLQLAI